MTETAPSPSPAQSLVLPQFSDVFLDMDGVLADFMSAACEIHDQPTPYTGEWDMAAHFGITSGEFWAKIERATFFWRDIKPLPYLSQVLSLAGMLSSSVHLLSSPACHSTCHSGKFLWRQKNIPIPGPELILCKAEHKHLLATPNRLLIDDKDENCQSWRDAGGKAIVFPQPWNSARHAVSLGPMFYLAQELEKLAREQIRPEPRP